MKQKASLIFTYMVLAKIMSDSLDEASNLLIGRYGQIYTEMTEKTILMRDI